MFGSIWLLISNSFLWLAGKMASAVNLIVTVFTCVAFCNGSKLNVPKLLLPHNSLMAANYTLEASEGCFTWWDGSAFGRHVYIIAQRTTICVAKDTESSEFKQIIRTFLCMLRLYRIPFTSGSRAGFGLKRAGIGIVRNGEMVIREIDMQSC